MTTDDDVPLTMVTLAVRDLDQAAAFYEAVGFAKVFAQDGIVFLRTRGSALALYGWDDLAADVTVDPAGWGFRGFTLASNQSSEDQVDATLARWVAAGAAEVKPAARAEWGGYSGYVADPDGHLWETAYNPGPLFQPGGALGPG
jgi:uncharacterized glyoxalase superfamily protein PhnB